MKLTDTLPVAFFLTWTMSCSSGVRYDYDPAANLTDVQTYEWMEQPAAPPGNANDALTRNSLLDRRIKNAVNTQLAAKGLRQDANDPDFLVAYHVGLEDKIDIQRYGYRYARVGRYWGVEVPNVQTREYKQGTLILDFVDPDTKELIWRASGSGRAKENQTPEEAEQSINRAVAIFLEEFPPGHLE